jgi:peptide/nickel transport system permease protein
MRTGRGVCGMALLVVVLVIALFGPFFTTNDPAAIVGAPGTGPGPAHPLGLDYLGRDVLTRVLWGGRSVIWLSIAATALCFAIGLTIGLIAGYVGGIVDPVLMRMVDVVLCFPPLLFFLLVATSVGTSQLTLIVGVAIVLSPGMARIVYSATKETATRGYVEAAVMRGESTPSILRREILPNILAPVIANLGLLVTFSILLIAAVNFLGIGIQPPAANWALMISENRPIISINVWATLAPAALLAVLTIGVNLVGDAFSHTLGRTESIAEAVAAPAGPGSPTFSPTEVA